ncbi:MAG: hypothetical protein M1337_07085 [Actinobacteria bacterium]|nr:hypothetical protein [Actinomycetota bacterium]
MNDDVFGGAIFFLAGSGYVALGVYRLRHPNWFRTSWWSRHRVVAMVIHPDQPWLSLTGKPYEEMKTSRAIGTAASFLLGVPFALFGLVMFTKGLLR